MYIKINTVVESTVGSSCHPADLAFVAEAEQLMPGSVDLLILDLAAFLVHLVEPYLLSERDTFLSWGYYSYTAIL